MTQAFNLSQFANKVNTSGQADLTTAVTGTLPVANGGTGAASLTGNSVAITNSGGTALSTVAAGTTGNVLTSDGTTWISQAATGGQLQTELFTAPGTWSKPASASQVRVTVVGGGGGNGTPGGPTGPITGTTGGTSSFGPAVSATGGGGGRGLPALPGTPGVGTVSVGTSLRTTSVNMTTNWLFEGPGQLGGNAIAFSISSSLGAGKSGSTGIPAGFGGFASAIVPVSAPVTITVGAGGAGGGTPVPGRSSGVGGAILVEFVG
jgi:hypothetical protein